MPDAIRLDVVAGTVKESLTVDVSIRPDPLARVEVIPHSYKAAEKGENMQFTARGLDQYGNEIPGLAFLWEATGGTIDQTGQYTADGAFGIYDVTASATYRESSRTGSVTAEVPLGWVQDPYLRNARTKHTAVALEDGRVLIIGGYGWRDHRLPAEVYDPATGALPRRQV